MKVLKAKTSLDLHIMQCSVTRSIGTSVNSREARVCPVRGGDGGVVLLLTGLVEHRQQLRGLQGGGLQVDHGVRTVAVVGVEDEVAVEVSCIEPGQGQTVAVPGEGSLDGGHGGPGCGGVQVVEQVVGDVTGNSTTLR